MNVFPIFVDYLILFLPKRINKKE
nr:NADH-plastoquinone oxidoreductase subunit 4 [Zygophyllum kansuense]UJH21912.1 NADH-plastoquinone oxidoreductase subunit 4 [Zygophyllum kansuense]